MSIRRTTWAAALVLAGAACGPAPGHAEEPSGFEWPDTERQEGVLYDPQADYDQGVFAAEEEIESDQMTIWVITSTNRPPGIDQETGLPLKHILVAPDEPWHKRCMEERVRGHNDAIRRHLGLAPGEPAGEAAEHVPQGEPQRDSSGEP